MKEEILATSLKQFLKYGIREMSIQKLVEPLSISTKTVYKYFENKEDLLEHALLLLYDQQFDMLKDLSRNKNTVQLFVDVWYIACSRLFEVKNVFHEDLEYYYPELKLKVEKSISSKFTGQFISIVMKGIEEGVFEERIIPSIVLNSIYSLLGSITRQQSAGRNPSDHDLFLNTIAIYIRGICTTRGLKKFEEHISTLQPLGAKPKVKN